MKVYFTNFWDGFYNGTDANHAQFFIELFTKAFGEEIEVGSFEESKILCESIFGSPVVLTGKKKFKYTVLFSGESRLNGLEDHYDIVLYGERNHKNRVNCPLFVPYRWCNSYLQIPQPTRFITPPKLNKVLCVIGNDGGEFRNQYLDRLERRGIQVDYAGSYRKSVSDPRIENTRYWHRDYLKAMGEYKFVLAMENSKGDTYITEKIVNPLEAGSIPIYWGSDRIGDYFNKDRCIFVGNSPKEQEESIDDIERLLNNQEAYMSKLIQPSILDDWRTIDDIARDLQTKLQPAQREVDPMSGISSIRIISSPDFEPKRYSKMVELMNRMGVHPSKYVIDAKTYKHTIAPEQYNHYVKRNMMELLPWVGPFRRTKRAELSLFLNYYWHLLDLDRRYKEGIFLVLESDVQELDITLDEFPKFIKVIDKGSEIDWSLISIGFGAQEDILYLKGREEFQPYHVVQKLNTRCADSMLWSKKGIEQFLKTLKQEDYSEPFDHYIGRHAEENNDFIFYWAEPAFFKQQSNYGNDPSTIQSDEY